MPTLAVLAACGSYSTHNGAKQQSAESTTSANGATTDLGHPKAARPLEGLIIVVNPGHNRGNVAHSNEIKQLVDAGNGTKKACDTTGTQTNDGYQEADFTWDVSQRLVALLTAAGARAKTTLTADTPWGPCVNQRAAVGNNAQAAAVISIHGDGGPAGGSGFHVLEPGLDSPIKARSHQLAVAVRDAYLTGTGMRTADYIGRDGLNLRTDMAGLNLSKVPTMILESGNMRNAADAARMKDPSFRQKEAESLVRALQRFLQ
ncbi:MAG: N-acetylmuramoyl-L-alanine amidase [Mycobacteriales bacterium]